MTAQQFLHVAHCFALLTNVACSCHRIGFTIEYGFKKSKWQYSLYFLPSYEGRRGGVERGVHPHPRFGGVLPLIQGGEICYHLNMFAITAVPEGLSTLTSILAIGIAVIFHEVSHGHVANWLGDPTAKYAGRLSLNPIKHIDLWGTIIIPGLLILTQAGFVFGWAKPVPVNYYNLRYGKYGPLLVALAGPAANFLILVICGILIRISPADTALPYLFIIIGLVNTFLMLFNLLPIPPLDGSKVLFIFLEKRPDITMMLERYGMFILLGIIIFFPGFLSQFVFAPAIAITSFITGVPVFDLINLL